MKNQYTSTIKKDHFEIKVDLDRESHSVFIGSDLIHKVGELAISQLKNNLDYGLDLTISWFKNPNNLKYYKSNNYNI